MKSLAAYIFEKSDDKNKDEEKKSSVNRREIQFTIWESPDKKIQMIKNNEKYQKIEYKYIDKDEDIAIDFLMGFQDGNWKLWVGKLGSCSYDDDPYFSFDTDNFKQALIKCIDKVEEFINKVKDDKDDYIRFYVHQ